MFNLMSLLGNADKLKKIAQLAILLPTVVSTVSHIHDKKAESSDAEKRAAVLGIVNRITDLLEARGHVSKEMNEGIDQTAAEVYDVVIEGLAAVK